MDISKKKLEKVNVLSLSGRLDASSAGELEKALNSLIESGQVQQVINLDKLEYISSSGLRVLLATLKTVKGKQGDLKLVGLKPFVKEVFDITGFTQLFTIVDTEEAAINSFD